MELSRTWLELCHEFPIRLFVVLLLFAVAASSDLAQDIFESPDPILMNETGSTRVLAVPTDGFSGGVPAASSGVFRPGSRIVIFISGIGLLPGEGANAFRVFAEDRGGKKYRFSVDEVRRLSKRSTVHALFLSITDRSGFNGQPANGDLLIRVAWRGNASNRLLLVLGNRESKAGSDPSFPSGDKPSSKRSAERFSTMADRKRFMEQASFGPSHALEFRLRQIGIARWIEEQFAIHYPTIPYPDLPPKPMNAVVGCGGEFGTNPEIDRCYRDFYWAYTNQNWFLKETLYGDDQLRRRVAWALHQIWVVSENTLYQQRWMQEYIEILDRNAFGNYRDLIWEMTLSPGMGEYLDMVRSTRINPNENYPRELLQLFTVGLDKLNPDGTLLLDKFGNRVPTYDQETVEQFTKVFTGWTRCDNGTNPSCPNAVVGAPNFIDPVHLSVPDNHDLTEKNLFDYPGAPNKTILPCFACVDDFQKTAYAYDSLERTIDNIFHHPNVGPFVGKLLIQHLVTSDPSPAYVQRVADAFNNNGAGVRGDMKAVVRAVLLDPEARGTQKTEPTYGKLREPLQHVTNILRLFNPGAGRFTNDILTPPPRSCQNKSDGVFAWTIKNVGQEIWYPPNVFSYFSPFAVVPGTDILGPEFSIVHSGSSFARSNLVWTFTAGEGVGFDEPTTQSPYPWTPCGTSADLTEIIAVAASEPTGNALIEYLNTRMMHGTMSSDMKSKLRPAIEVETSSVTRAKQALFLVASSSQYQVQR